MIFFPFIGKLIALIVAALGGLAQWAIFFNDTGTDAAFATQLIVSVPLALVGGVIFGYNFRRLWPLAVVNLWAPLVVVVLRATEMSIETEHLQEAAVLAVPIVTALFAGWLGAKLKALKNLAVLLVLVAVGAGILVMTYTNLDLTAFF